MALTDNDYVILTRAVKRSKEANRHSMRILATAVMELGGELPAAKASQWKALEDCEEDDEQRKAQKAEQRNAIVCEMPVAKVEKLLTDKLSEPSTSESE